MKGDPTRPVVVVGGGVTGLSAGAMLGEKGIVLEKEGAPGGCLRSDAVGAYTVDRTGHLFHMRQPWILRMLERGGMSEWVDHERDARVRVLGHTVAYPIQYNLAGLPPGVIAKCLDGLCSAEPVSGAGTPFSEWATSSFGDGLWELFFEPYNQKLWHYDLDEMTADWTGRFVPPRDFKRAVEGALVVRDKDPAGYNSVFSYPARGGSQAIPDALARLAPRVECGQDVVAIDWQGRVSRTAGGASYEYSALVSTMPITQLAACLHPRIPELDEIVSGLRHNSIGYVVWGGPSAEPDWHWLYIADPAARPCRVGNLGSYASGLAPAGHAMICVEQAFAADGVIRASDDELVADSRVLLGDLGLLHGEGALEPIHVGRLNPAYVVFTYDTRVQVARARRLLMERGIISTGRYGAWTYGAAGDAMRQGCAAARLAKRWVFA